MAANAGSPRITTPGPSRRWFWLLLVVSVAALILAGVAVALELTRSPTGPTNVFSATFVAGSIDSCSAMPGFGPSYCDLINLTMPGGHGSDRLVLLEANFNESCPSNCEVSFGSYPHTGDDQFFNSQNVNRSVVVGGVVWGGPDWVMMWQQSVCAGTMSCAFVPVDVTIQIEDYGAVPD